MKITAFILLFFGLHLSAATLAQNVTLSEHKAPLEKVLNDIRQQSGYVFFYNQEWMQESKPVDLEVKNRSLEEALKLCFKDQPFDYAIVNKTIVLKLKEKPNPAPTPQPAMPPVTVTGKVVDELGNPMANVTVRQKDNPNNGTITDAKGVYTLNVPDNNTVVSYSFVGYETQELKAKDIPSGSVITLKAAPQNLREVTVNKGYYREKTELSTSDVGLVTSKEIEEQPVSDPLQALIGRVAGLDIQQSSGIPGAYATVRIRGVNSLQNGTAPLYVVDGVPYSSNSLSSFEFQNALGSGTVGGVSQFGTSSSPNTGLSPFNALNPSDIEDIQILKDADATAIYGSRGANGVILITTKKGKAGETKVDINMSQGVGQVTRMIDLMNTQQYLQMRHQAYANDGLAFPSIATSPTNTNYDINGFWDTTRYTNLQKALIGNTANYTNVQGSVSGGNVNTQFLIGGGYNRQTTVYPGNYDDTKGSVHMSINHASSNQRFHLQFTASYVYDNDNVPVTDLTSSITMSPDIPPLYNPDGTLNWAIRNGTATFSNPLAPTLRSSTMQTNNLISNIELSYLILPGLTFKSDFGFNRSTVSENALYPSSADAPPNDVNPSARFSEFANTSNQTWNIDPQLNYSRKVGKGMLNVLVGATFQQNLQQDLEYQATGFPSDALVIDPLAASFSNLIVFSKTLYRYNQIIGRINYTFDDKYILNFTANRDGSSNFGPGRQWANFGAIGAGWIFSKAKPIRDEFPALSFGKLRASYGTTGNDQLTPYQFLSTYNPSSTTYQGTAGLMPTGLTNSNFGWEVVKKFEGGIDLGFLKDRINLSVNYYVNRTGNQLVGYPLPSITGFTTIQYNLPAVLQNSGLEVELNTVNVKAKDFNWTTSVIFSMAQYKLVWYPGLGGSRYSHTYIIGQSVFIKEVYKSTGVNPQTGLYTFATQNANGRPSYPQDLYPTAPITQKYYGGIRNTFSYKDFSLDIFIQFVDQLGVNYMKYFVSPGLNANEPVTVLNGDWLHPGDVATEQRFGTNSTTSTLYNSYLRNSNAIYTNASFIRVKNAALSYRLPAEWRQWARMQNARIFLQAQNLFTFTHYLGLDPETQGLTLPPLRMITAGVSAQF